MKPFFKRPHSKLHRSPSVTSNASVTSTGYLPAAVSLPEWSRGELKIHCTQVRMGSNPIADMSGWSHSARKRKLALSPGVALRSTQVRMGPAASLTCGWRHTERKETTGTRGLPERHAFSLSLFLSGPTLKTSPISQCHQECQCDQQWLLVGSSQFARVVKGVNLRSTARKCAWVRTP